MTPRGLWFSALSGMICIQGWEKAAWRQDRSGRRGNDPGIHRGELGADPGPDRGLPADRAGVDISLGSASYNHRDDYRLI